MLAAARPPPGRYTHVDRADAAGPSGRSRERRRLGALLPPGYLSHRGDGVEIATNGSEAGVLHYRLHLTRQQLGRAEPPLWIDSRRCPAVRRVLADMERLRMPQPDAPGVGADDTVIVLDGVGYALEAPSTESSGRLSWRSNVGTPLAGWIDRSMAAPSSCWQADEPAQR